VFIDEVRLEVKGGDGGGGAVSFRRERYVPRGGPDGGDGGRGGSVYAVGDGALRTLNHLAGVEAVAAGRGRDGGGRKRTGRAGEYCRIKIPLGTEVRAVDGEPLGEILKAGDEIVMARGGRGGRGNARFATPTLRVPRYAEKGGVGERRRLRFTLKLIADVALVGPPNAGKSSLLAAMSPGRPKIAAYPVTTLAPQLGSVAISPACEFAVVEVPGLLEGAAEGKGLGRDFLRHVERAKALVIVVDVAAGAPARDYGTVLRELALFEERLAGRVKLVVANKVDLPHEAGAVEELRRAGTAPTALTSAISGEGVEELKHVLWEVIERYDHPRS
jgi:GTP-binding protein